MSNWTQRTRVDSSGSFSLAVSDALTVIPATYSATATVACVVYTMNVILALKGITGPPAQAASQAFPSLGITTESMAFPSANTAGNMLVVVIAGIPNDAGPVLVGCSDSNGNSYSKPFDQYFPGGADEQVIIFIAPGCAAGANTVTVTFTNEFTPAPPFSSNMSGVTIALLEYPGGTGADVSNYALSATGGSLTVSLTTTANADTLLNVTFMSPDCHGSPTAITGPSGGLSIPGAWYVTYEYGGSPPSGSFVDRSSKLFLGDGHQHDFNLQIRQRGNASYTLVARFNDSYTPTINEPIFLFDQTAAGFTLVFSGILQDFTTRFVGIAGDRYFDCTAASLESIFDTVEADTPVQYLNQTCGAIFTDLFNRFEAGALVSLGTIQAGPTIPLFSVKKGDRISDLFTQLATSAEFTWGVNPQTLLVYFQVPSAVASPFSITSSYALWDSATIKQDAADYRNRQGVRISYDALPHSGQFFVGAGQSSLTLLHPVEQVTNAWITPWTPSTATVSFTGQPSPGDTATIGPANIGWQAHHVYALGGLTQQGGFTFEVTTAGTSGGTLPAGFATQTATGDTVADGSVIWTCKGATGLSTGTQTYTFVSALDNTQFGQVLIGATVAATVQNFADAINAMDPYGGIPATNGAGITFSLPTWESSQVIAISVTGTGFTVQGKQVGSAPRATLAASSSAFAWSAAATSGGTSPQPTAQDDFQLNVYAQGTSTASPGLAYQEGSNIVTLATPLDAGSNLTIEYTRPGGDIIFVEDTPLVTALALVTHGTGKYQQLTDQSAQGLIATSAAAGLQLAQQALASFDVVPIEIALQLFQPGLLPGQIVTLNLSGAIGAALNGSYYIEEIRGQIIPTYPYMDTSPGGPVPGGGHYRYTLKLIDVAQIGSYLDFWLGLGGGGAGGSAAGGALVATSGGAHSSSGLPGVILETNGAANSSQTTLNLTAGAGVTLTDEGSGDIQITASAPGSVAATKFTASWSAQTSVTITHNLGTTAVLVQVFDGSGNLVNPQNVQVTSANVVTLTFGASFTGTATIIGFGGTFTAADFTQSWTAQTSVTVTHNLGTENVMVAVYDASGDIVTPQSITITSANVVTLTFGAAFTGSVLVAALPTAVRQSESSWTAQTSVTVTHDLGTTAVIAQVYDTSGNQVIPQNVLVQDANNVVLTFGASFSGSIVIMG